MSQTSIQHQAMSLGVSGKALKRQLGLKRSAKTFQASHHKSSKRSPQDATAASAPEAAPAAE